MAHPTLTMTTSLLLQAVMLHVPVTHLSHNRRAKRPLLKMKRLSIATLMIQIQRTKKTPKMGQPQRATSFSAHMTRLLLPFTPLLHILTPLSGGTCQEQVEVRSKGWNDPRQWQRLSFPEVYRVISLLYLFLSLTHKTPANLSGDVIEEWQ